MNLCEIGRAINTYSSSWVAHGRLSDAFINQSGPGSRGREPCEKKGAINRSSKPEAVVAQNQNARRHCSKGTTTHPLAMPANDLNKSDAHANHRPARLGSRAPSQEQTGELWIRRGCRQHQSARDTCAANMRTHRIHLHIIQQGGT